MDTWRPTTSSVDAVVYPGLLSDISLNDGGGGTGKAASAAATRPGAANGIPTLAFPAGMNDHGQPINIQLLGRAWDDAQAGRHGLRVRVTTQRSLEMGISCRDGAAAAAQRKEIKRASH